jgi:hypothetical protein
VVAGLLLLLILGGSLFWFFQYTQKVAAPPNEVVTYLEDESQWLPDAVVESDSQILEMKFGN